MLRCACAAFPPARLSSDKHRLTSLLMYAEWFLRPIGLATCRLSAAMASNAKECFVSADQARCAMKEGKHVFNDNALCSFTSLGDEVGLKHIGKTSDPCRKILGVPAVPHYTFTAYLCKQVCRSSRWAREVSPLRCTPTQVRENRLQYSALQTFTGRSATQAKRSLCIF